MTVLDLEDVGYHGVGCLRSDEVLTSLLEAKVVLRSKVAQEELVERFLVCLADGVT